MKRLYPVESRVHKAWGPHCGLLYSVESTPQSLQYIESLMCHTIAQTQWRSAFLEVQVDILRLPNPINT